MKILLEKNMRCGQIIQGKEEETENIECLRLQVYGRLKPGYKPVPTVEHLKQQINYIIKQKTTKTILINGIEGFIYDTSLVILFRRANLCGIDVILLAKNNKQFWYVNKIITDHD